MKSIKLVHFKINAVQFFCDTAISVTIILDIFTVKYIKYIKYNFILLEKELLLFMKPPMCAPILLTYLKLSIENIVSKLESEISSYTRLSMSSFMQNL